MKQRWMGIVLLCLAATLACTACSSASAFRGGNNMQGVVKLGPFPKQAASVAGYNLYLSENPGGPFQKINDEPVLGYSSLMVPYLKAGQVYYFRMTAVGFGTPPRESRPGAAFKRTAVQSWN
ncbi:MAG TPA: fibronectin type III domain-containing protein [bacterium]|jgi:hypothetical protein|nr:fibronectin type III domain-containing protein [bacterium]